VKRICLTRFLGDSRSDCDMLTLRRATPRGHWTQKCSFFFQWQVRSQTTPFSGKTGFKYFWPRDAISFFSRTVRVIFVPCPFPSITVWRCFIDQTNHGHHYKCGRGGPGRECQWRPGMCNTYTRSSDETPFFLPNQTRPGMRRNLSAHQQPGFSREQMPNSWGVGAS
jgi:hypothetical protein